MSVNSISNTQPYNDYNVNAKAKEDFSTDKAAAEKNGVNKVDAGKTATAKVSAEKTAVEKTSEAKTSTAVPKDTYEKSSETKKATYTVNKMSPEERKALVSQLKADQASRQENLMNIVQQMMTGQASSFSIANGNTEDMWKFLAKGDFKVDAETQAQAQDDISEDGYYGVKQTSQRLFDFASALAGDDPEKMKDMQAAIEKGYNAATKAWGKELPQISQDTLDATNKMFEEYYETQTI